ncbi:hypothetical protein, partial [Oleiphilus sp. HI0061]
SAGGDIIPVFVATASCSAGDDPHWQCGGQWSDIQNVADSDFIAICPGAEGGNYSDCADDDTFVLFSNVTSNDGFFVCSDDVNLGGGRNGCSGSKYVREANFGSIDSVVTEQGGSDDSSAGTGGGENNDSSVGAGGSEVSFADVTINAFPDFISGQAAVVAPFEADLAHLNADGCLDAFITSHATTDPDGIYIQDNAGGVCQGTFSYLANDYSISGPSNRRITSWVMLLDLDGDSDTDILGADVDGNPSL